jgi:hypothetical protein
MATLRPRRGLELQAFDARPDGPWIAADHRFPPGTNGVFRG